MPATQTFEHPEEDAEAGAEVGGGGIFFEKEEDCDFLLDANVACIYVIKKNQCILSKHRDASRRFSSYPEFIPEEPPTFRGHVAPTHVGLLDICATQSQTHGNASIMSIATTTSPTPICTACSFIHSNDIDVS